jgi:hypothetical protein
LNSESQEHIGHSDQTEESKDESAGLASTLATFSLNVLSKVLDSILKLSFDVGLADNTFLKHARDSGKGLV